MGGEGSGHFGHSGRPGSVGGSVPGRGGGSSSATARDRAERHRQQREEREEREDAFEKEVKEPPPLIDPARTGDQSLKDLAEAVRQRPDTKRLFADLTTGKELTILRGHTDITEVRKAQFESPPTLEQLRNFFSGPARRLVVATPTATYVLTLPKGLTGKERQAMYRTLQAINAARTPKQYNPHYNISISNFREARPAPPAVNDADLRQLATQAGLTYKHLKR